MLNEVIYELYDKISMMLEKLDPSKSKSVKFEKNTIYVLAHFKDNFMYDINARHFLSQHL